MPIFLDYRQRLANATLAFSLMRKAAAILADLRIDDPDYALDDATNLLADACTQFGAYVGDMTAEFDAQDREVA